MFVAVIGQSWTLQHERLTAARRHPSTELIRILSWGYLGVNRYCSGACVPCRKIKSPMRATMHIPRGFEMPFSASLLSLSSELELEWRSNGACSPTRVSCRMVVGWREEAKYQLDKANVKVEEEECRVQRNGISRRDDEGARAVKDDKCSKQDSRAFFTRRLER
jgi:hypothetical protein